MTEYVIKLDTGNRLDMLKPEHTYFVSMIMPSIGRFTIKKTIFLSSDVQEAGVYPSLREAQQALETVKRIGPKMRFEHRFTICAIDEIEEGKTNETNK